MRHAIQIVKRGRVAKRVRYFAIFLLFLFGMVCYIDRVNIAVAGTPIIREFHLSVTEFGFALSAFTFGYWIFSLPVGMLIDRTDLRKYAIWMMLGWTMMTVLSGLTWALLPLIILRFIFGATEAGLGSVQTTTNYSWMLPRERGRVAGIGLLSLMIGVAVGAPINGAIVSEWGWRAAFYVTGLFSLAVAILFYFFFASRPRNHRWVSQEELSLIEKSQEEEEKAKRTSRNIGAAAVGERSSLRMLFSDKSLWLTGVALFLINFLYWAALQFLPTYFQLDRHSTILNSGFFTALPFLFAAAGNYFSGELTDRLFNGMRIPTIAIGAIVAAPCVLWAMQAGSVGLAVVAFMLMAFFNAWAIAQTYTLPMELYPEGKGRVAAITGFFVTCNSLAGILAPLIAGPIRDATGSFAPAFYIFGAANLVGGILYLFLYRREKTIKSETEYGRAFTPEAIET